MADTEQRFVFTVDALCEGFTVHLPIEVAPAKLPAVLQRLKSLGIEPAPIPGIKPKVKPVQPAYNGEGDPMCPEHKRVLKEGKWGLYCSARGNDGEYCKLKFKE